LANSKQYVEAARSLATNPPAGALVKSRGADTLIYDKVTNTFLIKGADGAPRTMFRPTDGINYWNKQ
jgi:pyocin large subunit-like protein